MTCHAFVFARGGSKGLPGKNTRLLLGKPLIQYSVEVALQTFGIDKVFVSTDDYDIAKVARSIGAIVIERPADLAQDDSSEWEAWKHAISWVIKMHGHFDQFVSLPATSPLQHAKDVESALHRKSIISADICIAITPSSRSPYFNMVQKVSNNLIELVIKPSNYIYRRQESPKVFDITTVVYVADVDFIMKSNSLFDGTVTFIEVPKHRSIDIDDIHDFNFAESILNSALNEDG